MLNNQVVVIWVVIMCPIGINISVQVFIHIKSNAKREVCLSFLKTHCGNGNKSTKDCSEQKLDKMPAKRKNNKSAKEENVSRGVKCTSKGIFKNEKKHKPRLTKRDKRKKEEMD